MALPSFVVLKSNYNGKYLRYTKEDGPKHRFLQFSGEEVDSPYVKYEVESAKSEQGLVNIRCCYNNKYWVASSENQGCIVAGADKPDEVKSNSSCTLFEPFVVDEKAQFRHVHLGHYARLWVAGDEYNSCLVAGSDSEASNTDPFTFIDWESLVILPKGLKGVAFKGDNGKYLSTQWIEEHQYLQFSCSDIEHPTVANEIITTCEGSVRIKSTHVNKFWRLSPGWIWADSDDTSCQDSATLFWPIKVDNNTIALRNLGNNKFCKRLTADWKDDCLNATEDRITSDARLVVEELLLSRKISHIQYRLMDSRTYGQHVVTMAKASACNKTQEASSLEIKVGYTKKESKTWNTSVSLKLGISTTVEAGVPVFVDGKINISAEVIGTHQWGETKETTEALEFKYTDKVGPMTEVTASVLATVASFDVPFSYTQTELLSNGTRDIRNMDDGVFTGITCYDIKHEVDEKSLK